MKVLYVMRNIWGGGAPKRFWMIHRVLAQKGFDITLLSTRNASTYQKFPKENFQGIKITQLKISKNLSDYFFYLKAAKYTHKVSENYDIVHDDFSPVAPYSCLWHKKTIATIHEVFGTHSLQRYGMVGLLPLINERLYSKIGYRTFVCPSHSTAEKLRELGVNSFVIPNGVEANVFYPAKKLNDNDNLIITMASRFVPVKGHIFFIKMAAKLLKKYKNLQFILPSTGPLLGEVKKIASEANMPIIFPGYLETEQDLVEIMQKSDIYVNTSLQEGFGISVCEAMSCQLPIVAFDADGVKDVVTPDCGFLTPIGNVDQLVDKVELLIKDKALRDQMGAHSRQRVLKEFTWEKAAEKMQSIYCRTNNP